PGYRIPFYWQSRDQDNEPDWLLSAADPAPESFSEAEFRLQLLCKRRSLAQGVLVSLLRQPPPCRPFPWLRTCLRHDGPGTRISGHRCSRRGRGDTRPHYGYSLWISDWCFGLRTL